MKERDPKELLTRREIAEILKIDHRNIQHHWPELIKFGAFRFGQKGRWRMMREDLDSYLQAKREGRI